MTYIDMTAEDAPLLFYGVRRLWLTIRGSALAVWRLICAVYALPSRPEILGVGATTFGATFWLQADSRSSSHAYDVVRTILPVSVWGFLLFLGGMTLLGGVALRPYVEPNRGQLVQSIAAGLIAAWCASWAVPLLWTAHENKTVSYVGGELWLLWGMVPNLFLAFGREG